MMHQHIAVVGGGIFGVTAAVELARHGHRVDLFERQSDLLQGASGINQYRLHRGYHYPRSPETVVASKRSEASFREEYAEAVIDENAHYYAIAARDTLTDGATYRRYLQEMELEYSESWPQPLRPDLVELCVRVREALFDPFALRRLCWEKLRRAGVRVHLDVSAEPATLESYDLRVIATYSGINRVLPEGVAGRLYQFEVCEKPVVRLPREYERTSIVVMDGPFMCIDPLGRTGLFVMGNVVHAIHHANVGSEPEIPSSLRPLLDRGVVENPPASNFRHFVDSACQFFNGIEQAEHVGSMFTVRTVLPHLDSTDARPTVVNRVDDRTITLFSGKIGTCISAAREALRLVEAERHGEARDLAPPPRVRGTPAPVASAAADRRT